MAPLGERVQVEVEGLYWDTRPGRAVDKLRERGISTTDVEDVLAGDPLFFEAMPGPYRIATHAMVGGRRARTVIAHLHAAH